MLRCCASLNKRFFWLCFAAVCGLTLCNFIYQIFEGTEEVYYDVIRWCKMQPNSNATSPVNIFVQCINYDGRGSFKFPNRTVSELWLCDNVTSARDRVTSFNDALTSYRNKVLLTTSRQTEVKARRGNDLVRVTKIVYTYGRQYFRRLRKVHLYDARLTTIFMRWVGDECSPIENVTRDNMLLTRFYRWTGVKPPCDWWDATQHFLLDSAYCQPYRKFKHRNQIPMTSIIDDMGATAVDYIALNKYDRSVDDDSKARYAFFVHIIENGIVTPAGDVYVGSTVRLISNGCDRERDGQYVTDTYDEVFAASQVWAIHSFYHLVIEGLTKMATMLQFLRDNPSIRVHVAKRNQQVEQVFEVLGLNPERIVTGYSRGKIVYWPRPTNCYEAPLPDLQIIAEEYKKYIASTSNDVSRNSVVYIRRIHDRRFERNDEIEKQTQQISEKYGLRFELFPEDPQLSLNETMYMFYRAKVIVAPHGAGLLNMQYCRRATIIVEAIDNLSNCPCFLLMAHTLGHRYHAVGATGGRTIVRVNVKEFINSVEFHIKYAAEHPESFHN